jgi:hypothetical protein
MSGPRGETAARVGGLEAARGQREQARYSAPCCGKAAAVRAYCCGWLSLAATQALFRRNPDWRQA